jgi:nitric oxide reductase NorD protein
MAQPASLRPFDLAPLRPRREQRVDMVLSARRSVLGPARELEPFRRVDQERFLAAVELIAGTSVELAYNFCMFGVRGLGALGPAAWDDWVLHLLDRYDEAGVLACIVAMQKVDEYAAASRSARQGLGLEEVRLVLERYICALSGRALKVAGAEYAYTDTETLFLPERVLCFSSQEENFRLYKVTAVHLWAQTRFGTWCGGVAQRIGKFEQPDRALRLFHALERIRLDACIGRDLPGVYRDIQLLGGGECGALPSRLWEEAAEHLRAPGATLEDTHRLLPFLYEAAQQPPRVCYQGELVPERAETVIAQRLAREKQALQVELQALAEELITKRAVEGPEGSNEANAFDPETAFDAVRVVDSERPEVFHIELRLQGEPVPPHAGLRDLLDSIVQDLGAIPDDYLVPAGSSGAYRPGEGRSSTNERTDPADAGFYPYDEWDHLRNRYRKDFCLLYEREMYCVVDDFVERTLEKYRGLLKHLYRTFEALRGENKLLRRQADGSDIDLDAAVEAHVDLRVGLEASDRLFTRPSRLERNIAVMFMVDVSGSTKGWINDLEREALVLLCESLETLGDRYAIYGFSGLTHRCCELYRIKRFEEPYSEAVRARISGIRPRDYTRMGVVIRHLTRLLLDVEARTRLLITLSDGRPDDQDGYCGPYGIEDTRQALLEARYQGIHPYCVTIDEEAMEYLPHMYGPVHFTVVDQVDKLPQKISDIYRRLTM